MENDVPIPRQGKLMGWKHPKGVQKVGSAETPDTCPFCGTDVQPSPGRMGQGSIGEGRNPEPWKEVAKCPQCDAGLHRIPGDPWTGTAA